MSKRYKTTKSPYEPPRVIVYGSVRNLTGGSRANGLSDAPLAGNKNNGSDRSIKENIVELARHPAGFGLYLFDYLPEFRDTWGHGRQFGVMADEVEAIIPQAVSKSEYGYAVVDYDQLGITRH